MITDDFYKYGILTVVAKSADIADKVLKTGKRALLLSDKAEILPEKYPVSDKIIQELNELHDYDVVEFYSDEKYHCYYNSSANDHVLFITNRCNSNCIMCPAGESERKRDDSKHVDELCELIEYMPSDAPFVTVTGGEPTLIKDGIFTVLRCAREHFDENTEVFFLTNGRAFCNKEFFEELSDCLPKNIRFAIPIYGNSAETHDAITQAPGSFSQTVCGLKRLIEIKADIEIRIVVSKLNYLNMSNIADYIIEHLKGISCVHIMATEMCGAAARNRDAVWIDYREAFEHSKTAIQKLLKNGFNVKLYNFPLCKVEKPYWPLCAKSISDYKVRYYDSCDLCKVKEICGGVFNTTLLLSKMELTPITEE